MTDNAVADAIRELHRSDENRECGARATLTLEHSSGGEHETRLLCYEEL